MNNICRWKACPIFPSHYEVSDSGEVRNSAGKILKPAIDKYGYLYYVLCVNGDRRTIKAHRLVALAFIENPNNKPSIDHINGNKQDNRIENLRWVTNKENTNNPITKGKLSRILSERNRSDYMRNIKAGQKKTVVYRNGELIGTFVSQKEASEYTNVCQSKVSQCVTGKKVSCKGYIFKEEEGCESETE